jgi:serine/threonine-protein kinase
MNLPDGFLLQDNKYRITGTIGQGGFGITYIAVWNTEVKGGLGTMKTEVPVCIKEYFFKDYCYREANSFEVKIHSKTGAELFDKFKEKLIKEANILSAVHHPYIVNVLEVFEENNTAYIVMEYIAGCSLKYMLDREGVLPEEKALKYIHQIGNALCFVHEKNIVHLDIKPSNIIIDKDDNARLIDFGVSKRYDIDQKGTTTTTLTLSKGFASIEQYDDEGTQNFSPCPDIYSLGATMYNLLTGIIPVESILRAAKKMPAPSVYNSNISEKTEKAILKAMELKSADRFQSVKEMLVSLDIPSYELSENQLVGSKNPFIQHPFEDIIPKSVVSGNNSDNNDKTGDEDRTIISFVPLKETAEIIRQRKRKQKRKNMRRILFAAAIFLCVIVGYATYNYFRTSNFTRGDFILLNADTSQTYGKFTDNNGMNFNGLESSKQVENKPEEVDAGENNRDENNKSIGSIENNRNIKMPGKDSTGSAVQQKDSVRKQKKYDDFYASALANYKKKSYLQANADIQDALKVNFTDEAYGLSQQIKEELDKEVVAKRSVDYTVSVDFGNNLRIARRKDTQLYGAVDRNFVEKIPCKYKTVSKSSIGRAFERSDNKFDIWNEEGMLVSEGVPKVN